MTNNDYSEILPFDNREEAGKVLAKELMKLNLQQENPIVLGIPRGGLPVGYKIAEAISCPLDAIVLRKLPIPRNVEAGFGAVTIDKTVLFNDEMLRQLQLPQDRIDGIIERVYQEVIRRDIVYRHGRPFPRLHHRSVILTDDGLATGYTMLAAVNFARKKQAKEIIVAVPVAHRQSYELVKKEADKIIALYVSDQRYFAVASFYKAFPDMDDKEVVAYLERSRKEGGNL